MARLRVQASLRYHGAVREENVRRKGAVLNPLLVEIHKLETWGLCETEGLVCI